MAGLVRGRFLHSYSSWEEVFDTFFLFKNRGFFLFPFGDFCTVSKETLQTRTVASTISFSALSLLLGLAKLRAGTYQLRVGAETVQLEGKVCFEIRPRPLASTEPVPNRTILTPIPSTSADQSGVGRITSLNPKPLTTSLFLLVRNQSACTSVSAEFSFFCKPA